jgi:ribonuclease J
MKLLLNLVRPKYFIPIHGELRHLYQHARLAHQVGIPEDRVLVIENGMVVELTPEGTMRLADRIPGGYVFVDGVSVGEVGRSVMREREILGQDGFVLVNLTLDRSSCRLREVPEIITRGFVYEPEASDLLENTRRIVTESVNCVSNGRLREDLEQTVKSFLYSKTKRRPMVFITISQV